MKKQLVTANEYAYVPRQTYWPAEVEHSRSWTQRWTPVGVAAKGLDKQSFAMGFSMVVSWVIYIYIHGILGWCSICRSFESCDHVACHLHVGAYTGLLVHMLDLLDPSWLATPFILPGLKRSLQSSPSPSRHGTLQFLAGGLMCKTYVETNWLLLWWFILDRMW